MSEAKEYDHLYIFREDDGSVSSMQARKIEVPGPEDIEKVGEGWLSIYRHGPHGFEEVDKDVGWTLVPYHPAATVDGGPV